jgi:hypothetical protein
MSANAQTPNQEIQSKINAGLYEEAAQILLAYKPTKLDINFFNARVFKAQKQYGKAATQLREILRVRPDMLNARRELAQVLFLDRKYAASEYQFRELSRQDPNSNVRPLYDRFLKRISNDRPFGISGSFSVVPSSNINRGTFNTTLSSFGDALIDEGSRQQTGTGIDLGLNGFVRKQISKRGQLRFDWRVGTRQYEGNEHDKYTAYGWAHYIYNGQKSQLSFGPSISRSWDTNIKDGAARFSITPKSNNTGLRANYIKVLNRKNRLYLNLQLEDQNYPNDRFLDGKYKYAQIGLRHQLNPSTAFSIYASRSESDKDDHFYDYHGYRGIELRVGAEKDWGNGLITSIGMFSGNRGYKADYISGLGVPRHDTYKGVTLGIAHTKIQFKGVIPRLSCRTEKGRSNVEFYDYNLRECNLSLSRKF